VSTIARWRNTFKRIWIVQKFELVLFFKIHEQQAKKVDFSSKKSRWWPDWIIFVFSSPQGRKIVWKFFSLPAYVFVNFHELWSMVRSWNTHGEHKKSVQSRFCCENLARKSPKCDFSIPKNAAEQTKSKCGTEKNTCENFWVFSQRQFCLEKTDLRSKNS